MGGVGQLACQGFLVREACVSVLVHGTGFLLSGVQWSPVMRFEMGLCIQYDFGHLSVDAQVYVPALLENLRGMSCSGIYWLLGGGWFQCRYGGFWMVSYSLMFCVGRSFLLFSGFGLCLLLLDFSFILPVFSRLLQVYSTDNKTSRLMVKRFSTMRYTQRGSQSYMKKRRGRR